MSKTKKLTRDEAEEFTRNLGQVAVGNYGLMEMARDVLSVPEALGLSYDEWVEKRLGGFVRMSIDQRRDAVRELSGERNSETGRWERSGPEVGELLGLSANTVQAIREELVELDRRALTPGSGPNPTEEPALAPGSGPKLDAKSEARRLFGTGKSDAEIALDLGVSAATVKRYRTEWKREQGKKWKPSPQLQEHIDAKKADLDAIPEAERKEAEAEFEEFVQDFRQSMTQAAGVYVFHFVQELAREVKRVMDADAEILDYEEVVATWAAIGEDLWVYGAKRGHDVSAIKRSIDRMKDEEGA